jgi:CHAT domain-containing protein
LQTELARRAKNVRDEEFESKKAMTPSTLTASLPNGAAFVDVVEYLHFQLPTRSVVGRTEAGSYERRFIAFVSRPQQQVEYIQLGASERIEEAAAAWRKEYGYSRNSERDLGAELRRLTWDKLEAHLLGVSMVLVAPEGCLARVPWGALPGAAADTYLIEDVAIAVFPTPGLMWGLNQHDWTPVDSTLLVIGDVDFNSANESPLHLPAQAYDPEGSVPQVEERFGPLAGTRDELRATRELFEATFPDVNGTECLDRNRATENEFRSRAPKHRWLHIATHAYSDSLEITRVVSGQESTDPSRESEDVIGRVGRLHSGLLSGLAMAGANRIPPDGGDNGILTALEVAELDLTGVELATLSACETGLGVDTRSEGLLGLQRAFQVAECRTVVSSLWKVPDRATQVLMAEFYENLWVRKMPKLEALRQAQITMLRNGTARALRDGADRGIVFDGDQQPDSEGRLPPYYWAAFVLSGDWQ